MKRPTMVIRIAALFTILLVATTLSIYIFLAPETDSSDAHLDIRQVELPKPGVELPDWQIVEEEYDSIYHAGLSMLDSCFPSSSSNPADPTRIPPNRYATYASSYSSVVVNLVQFDSRERGKLEQLWNSAPVTCRGTGVLEGSGPIMWRRTQSFPFYSDPYLSYQAYDLSADPSVRQSQSSVVALLSGDYLLVFDSFSELSEIRKIITSITAGIDRQLGTSFESTVKASPNKRLPENLLGRIMDPSCQDSAAAGGVEANGDPFDVDFDGDGWIDSLVPASCASATSRAPARIYVFSGNPRADATQPFTIIPVSDGVYLRNVTIVLRNGQLEVDADAISSNAPACCPDQFYYQQFSWDGFQFAARSDPILRYKS